MQAAATSKHLIDLERAKKLTGKFRQKKNELREAKLKNKEPELPICETFDRDAFDVLLSQPGCTGVRIYFGMDDKEEVSLVIVGVNEKGEDLLPAPTTSGATTKLIQQQRPVIVDSGSRCPSDCPAISPLNS